MTRANIFVVLLVTAFFLAALFFGFVVHSVRDILIPLALTFEPLRNWLQLPSGVYFFQGTLALLVTTLCGVYLYFFRHSTPYYLTKVLQVFLLAALFITTLIFYHALFADDVDNCIQAGGIEVRINRLGALRGTYCYDANGKKIDNWR